VPVDRVLAQHQMSGLLTPGVASCSTSSSRGVSTLTSFPGTASAGSLASAPALGASPRLHLVQRLVSHLYEWLLQQLPLRRKRASGVVALFGK
jgi:hypothetical protein